VLSVRLWVTAVTGLAMPRPSGKPRGLSGSPPGGRSPLPQSADRLWGGSLRDPRRGDLRCRPGLNPRCGVDNSKRLACAAEAEAGAELGAPAVERTIIGAAKRAGASEARGSLIHPLHVDLRALTDPVAETELGLVGEQID
jgi:hypothetical protein